MQLIAENFGFLMSGLAHTVELAFVTLLASTALGIVLGGIGAIDRPAPRMLVRAYVNVLRSIPLIVNVLFVYFVAPILGLSLGPFAAACLSLSLWGGANCAEIVRGGLLSVSRGQWEAARALGVRPVVTFRLVILPQALRPIIPALAGLFVLLVQSTALGALVGVQELFRSGEIIVERTAIEQGGSPAFLVYGTLIVIYFAMCAALTRLTAGLQARLDPQAQRSRTPVLQSLRAARESV